MSLRIVNPLPLVAGTDRFCQAARGLEVAEDYGTQMCFACGFALHDGASLLRQALGAVPDGTPYGCDSLVLSFEANGLEAAFARAEPIARVIHPIESQEWGGRVFRLFDPDAPMVEVGKP